MKIAIIGTGISGLGAAYLLNPHHEITVYEKNSYVGGHSRTIELPNKTPVDTGFIVFNDQNYPHLKALFKHLDVPYEKSSMTFGVSIADGWLEYSSGGVFAQKANLVRPAFYNMLKDIAVFKRKALDYIKSNQEASLAECLDQLKMGKWFREYYLFAMGAAIWSCPLETIKRYPAKTFLQFFDNHGLLNVSNHPQWYTVSGGSREYTRRLIQSFEEKIKLDCGAVRVYEQAEQKIVEDTQGNSQAYDHVIFACHADEAIALMAEVPEAIRNVVGQFQYQNNQIIVHADTSFMPKNKNCWASWIYLSEKPVDNKPVLALTYWMNNLQNIDHDYPVFVTLNPGRRPDESLIYDEHQFTHPIFDEAAVNAQAQIDAVQGADNYWFCGAYQRYGFHEDGLLSAVNMAEKLGVTPPWS